MSVTEVTVSETTIHSTQRSCGNFTGRVKWFNNKSGYGFITVLNEGEFQNKDIFVHHSSICVTGDLYKYLVQGEYVEFNIEKMKVDTHENQATNIKGVLSGALMCETRFNNKDMSKSREGFTQIKKKSYNRSH
tara:strand:+ start:1515 stop:1913 length:399 start_codon:yes stop_codon:yes gene_type:complete